MSASLSQLPSLTSLSAAVQVIPSLASILPYLSSAVTPLNVFTTQYLSLPNASIILPVYLSLLNSSLPAASAQFALTETQLQTFLSSAAIINLNSSMVSASLRQHGCSLFHSHITRQLLLHCLRTNAGVRVVFSLLHWRSGPLASLTEGDGLRCHSFLCHFSVRRAGLSSEQPGPDAVQSTVQLPRLEPGLLRLFSLLPVFQLH